MAASVAVDVEEVGRDVRARMRAGRRDRVDRHDVEAVAGEALAAGPSRCHRSLP